MKARPVTIDTRPLDNWVRAYDWQSRRQGGELIVYRVERWDVPLWWRLAHRLGVL